MTLPKRIILGISGASGAVYGIRALEMLRPLEIETHLIISPAAAITIAEETDVSLEQVKALADKVHNPKDIAACISSGSYQTLGMLIAPCSMRTLAEIATGVSSSLMSRAADVVLKERRRLVLMARETPLTSIHIDNMQRVTQAGGIIYPPVPAYYHRPESIDDIINQTVSRALELFDIDTGKVSRWKDSAGQ